MSQRMIAVLYIALGSYTCFWQDFYSSFECKFLTEYDKDYYVFTDDRSFFSECPENVHVIDQENLGWPGNTLYRFDMFLAVKDVTVNNEYIFFFNANYLCNYDVKRERLGNLESSLLFVNHPGFYGLKNYYYDYDRNKKSLAYVPYGSGEYYVQGCLLGGKPKAFWEMCEQLSKNIREDRKNGVIAKWHDESHVNRYIIGCEDVLVLDPGFAYPEFADSNCGYEPFLVLRDKERYIEYKDKRKRSDYWLYYKKKRLVGALLELFYEGL